MAKTPGMPKAEGEMAKHARKCPARRASWRSNSTRSPIPAYDRPVTERARHSLSSPKRLPELLVDTARIRHGDMIPLESSAGNDLEAHNPKDRTAFILTNFHGSQETAPAQLDPYARDDPPDLARRRNTALMGRASKGSGGIARRLLTDSADSNGRNRAGRTAPMMAVIVDHAGLVKELIAAGAGIEIADISGDDPVSLAYRQNKAAPKCCSMLRSHRLVNVMVKAATLAEAPLALPSFIVEAPGSQPVRALHKAIDQIDFTIPTSGSVTIR
jgi:ankyrin repeat protein